MSDLAIRAEGVSKQFRLGERLTRYSTLRDAIANKWRTGFRAKPAEYIWALDGVSFEVKAGEAIGVIGRNGSGKSTLLKVLSRITEPTKGMVEIHGRVGSLLEVGTGFHPELSGRENIYLNGAILGMRKAEIGKNFDEIVAFAEVEKFIDTPVKHYSSGMYLRLAFAVAAHLEPEILLVDEVLAVGDAAFQKKCMGKMGDVARKGRTVLFVSHNMGAVSRLCARAIWLDGGKLVRHGEASAVIAGYLAKGLGSEAERVWTENNRPGDAVAQLCAVRVTQCGAPASAIDITKPFEVEVETDVNHETELNVSIKLLSAEGQVVLHTGSSLDGAHIVRRGRVRSVCSFPAYTLNAGQYAVDLAADIPNVTVVFEAPNALRFTVEAVCPDMSRYSACAWQGYVGPKLARWSNVVSACGPEVSA